MIPAELRDGPMELEEVKGGNVFMCPRHTDAEPRTAGGTCELCAEEIADAEEEEAERWAGLTLKEKRDEMGGAYGGDRAED